MREAIIEGAASARKARLAALRGLYAVTPDVEDTAELLAMVEAAVQGGARVIQYRNKSADATLRRVQAGALARRLADRDALFIVNDDPLLAADVRSDGVHVGEEDAGIRMTREVVGERAVIGVSCYDDLGRVPAAIAAGADYIAFGSFFSSQVKPSARRAQPDLLREARSFGVPVVAIGGITAENAPLLRDAGADAVAVISAVFSARDPSAIEAAARAIASLFPH